MNLTPVEILGYLGFTVPPEGVVINPNDAYLHTSALRLVGATINLTAVSDDALRDMRTGMAGLVEAWTGKPVGPAGDDLDALRITLAHILMSTYDAAIGREFIASRCDEI